MAPVRLPRIVALIAFVGLFWWTNQAAPRIVPGILLVIVLYVVLTNITRTESLFGAFESSIARGFARPAPERKGGK